MISSNVLINKPELLTQVNRRWQTICLARVALVTALLLPIPTAADAQPRSTQRRPRATTSQKKPRDYSVFKHEDHRKDSNGKELACSSCHTINAPAQPDRISAATKPTINSSYPYHDSCFRCHREQVYRGDRPQICTVCHTRVSPRLTANDLYAHFPKPKPGDIMMREFPGYFPHGLHEAVMARSYQLNQPVLVRASFRAPPTDQGTKDICATCHTVDPRNAVSVPRAMEGGATSQEIAVDTFRTIPGFGAANAHTFCFGCHWKAQKPTKDECNGCHLAANDYQTRALTIIQPPAFSANAVRWFRDWPADVPKRFSLKFRHDTHSRSENGKDVNNHDLGCTTCHANIAQMTTLNIPKADVQITSCGPCHSATSAIPVAPGVRVTIFDEMTQKQDPAKKYTCVACHAAVIGREQAPCSHYAVIGEPCPTAQGTARK